MLLFFYKFRHVKHNNTILCKHFSIKSICAFDTCWWYNKMAYNVKSLYFTLYWWAICFSNHHFILVHLVNGNLALLVSILQQICTISRSNVIIWNVCGRAQSRGKIRLSVDTKTYRRDHVAFRIKHHALWYKAI